MTPFIALLALLVATTSLCLLPFLPALLELYRKQDSAPMEIVRDHDGNIRRFAAGLRQYLQEQLSDPTLGGGDSEPFGAPDARAGGPSLEGQFSDGTPFLVIRGGPEAVEAPYVMHHPPVRRMILAYRPLILPARARFPLDLFAAEALHGGEESVYRAILGEKEVLLARGSTVYRWLHTEDQLLVEPDSTLYGRASAERLIRLAVGCQFQRLHAARIEFGVESAAAGPPEGPLLRQPLVFSSASGHPVMDVAGRRTLVRGDLYVPPNCCFTGDLVVTGGLLLAEGACIQGSIKSYKEMVLARGAQVYGSVVSGRSIAVGPDCRLAGPVIAEGEITIEAGSRLGSEESPTSVCAPHLLIHEGVVAFGTVRAGVLGQVCPSPSMEVEGAPDRPPLSAGGLNHAAEVSGQDSASSDAANSSSARLFRK